MFPAPLAVWCEGEKPGYKTNGAVRFFGLEERTMATIVENDECSNEKEAPEHGNWNA